MPLVYQQNINETTRLGVWHIAESESFFLETVVLAGSITHPHKRLQHLAGRYLLTVLFEDFPLHLIEIADTRKPFIVDETYHFSISHCGDYAAAIVSSNCRVGVDIEVVSDKTGRLKDKYLTDQEQSLFDDHTPVSASQFYTLMWSIKESMFKWYGLGAVDFKKHLEVKKLLFDANEFKANCNFNKDIPRELNIHGLHFNNNFLSWVLSRG